jgi:hypothetical protein
LERFREDVGGGREAMMLVGQAPAEGIELLDEVWLHLGHERRVTCVAAEVIRLHGFHRGLGIDSSQPILEPRTIKRKKASVRVVKHGLHARVAICFAPPRRLDTQDVVQTQLVVVAENQAISQDSAMSDV